MSDTIPMSEKRSFFFFLIVFLICAISIFFDQRGLAIAALILGFFSLFRLTYLMEEQFENMPSFLSLPARILFGIGEKESAYKKNVLKIFQEKDVVLFCGIGFLFALWMIFCGLAILSQEEVSVLFDKDVPVIPGLSYFNMYETVHSALWLSVIGLALLLSMTFSQSKLLLKIFRVIFLPFFIGLFVLILWRSDLIVSLPPLYTAFVQGIGAGKAEILFAHQADIFLYPPTELFMRYIEVGLIGLILCFTVIAIPAFCFLKNLMSGGSHSLTIFSGVAILFALFIVDSFAINPDMIRPFQFIGFAFIGMVWGAAKGENSLTKSQK